MDIKRKKHFSSSQIIILGFSGVILLGSLLLMLPISSANNTVTPFVDTIFTATSAVCVTGLVVRDTATYWSMFGQFIILLLIQIGGMGVVTIGVSIATISGKKISLMQRSTMQEAVSAPQVGGIVKFTSFILKVTFSIELLGAVIMAPVFCRDFGVLKGLWYAVFHSISAFCNAGFDLMGVKAPFSSLVSYVANPVINGVILFLIVFGGIGFVTWTDMKEHKFHIRKYRMQSKVILLSTAILILLPAIYFFCFELGKEAFEEFTLYERIQAALFQAITPRTAGFNTIDLSKLSESGITITIVLMLIGGAPGSTAGGMKTTTLFVLILSALAVYRRKENVGCFGRRIDIEVIKNAAAILLMYVFLTVTGGIIISSVEQIPMLTCVFETASAIGTVGLTLGITSQLSLLSRSILILLMFLGRVGGLTIIFATISGVKGNYAKMPLEKITVG